MVDTSQVETANEWKPCMKHTLGTAAKAVGKSKATISKAIKSGKISATKREAGNTYVFEIDESELHRVYPPTHSETVSAERSETPDQTGVNSSKIEVLEAKLEMANKRIEELQEDRDEWRKQATRLLEKPQQRTGFWAGLFKR